MFLCSSCGKKLPRRELSNGVGISGKVCWDCGVTKQGITEKRPHNYTPAYFNKVGKSKDNLFFGIENEITVVGWDEWSNTFKGKARVKEAILDISKQYGFEKLYIKHDGTIGGEPAHGATGFEIVLQPHTLRALKATDWSGIFPQGVTRHPTCGMHIHISKDSFTTFHLYKFLEFVYNNKGFITTIGERDYTKYCTPNVETRTKIDAREKFCVEKGPEDIYRRQAVNLCNSATVELRFFANAEKEEVMMKNVEFCHALYMFTRVTPAKNSKSVKLFKSFVGDHPKKYPNLISFLAIGGSI